MNNVENRTSDTLIRVRDFGASRATDFPPDSLGGKMFAEVAAVVAELEHHATVQTFSAGGTRVGSATKANARATLLENLRAIKRTAIAITVDNPALKKKFALPRFGDRSLLNAALAFLEGIEPLAAEFAKHEMPDVLVNLKRDIDAFQAAVTQRNQSAESRVKATASLEAVLSKGVKAMLHLDAIVKNKYANDKPTLSAWESASHVERNNRRSKGEGKPDQGNVQPTKGSPAQGPVTGQETPRV